MLCYCVATGIITSRWSTTTSQPHITEDNVMS